MHAETAQRRHATPTKMRTARLPESRKKQKEGSECMVSMHVLDPMLSIQARPRPDNA
jgi:hypothetical protein